MNSRYVVLVVCDVEDWSSRPAVAQQHIQVALSALMDRALVRIGINRSETSRALRGDGMIIVLPGSTDKSLVTTKLVDALREGLIEYTTRAGDDEQIRLRLVLHAGDAVIGDGELAGAAVVQACRVVDSDVTRRVLSASQGAPLVLAVTGSWHQSTIAEGFVSAKGFEKVTAQAKGFTEAVWIRVPGRTSVPGLTATDRPGTERMPTEASRPDRASHGISISGGVVNGPVFNNPQFGGDYINGDKNVGRVSG
jgi:hypothetical protein